MKILVEKAVIEQALLDLERVVNFAGKGLINETTILTLREALAEQAEQEPVAEALSIDEALATLHASLKDGAKYGGWPINRNCEDGLNALTTLREVLALREALAEPHKQSCACEVCRGCDNADIKAEQAEQETVVKIHKYNEFQTLGSLNLPIGTKLYAAPVQPVMQEPVAYLRMGSDQRFVVTKAAEELVADTFHQLYAAPVRTKDLTDDEIMKINVDTASIVPTCDRQFHFARAVIAADRELNK